MIQLNLPNYCVQVSEKKINAKGEEEISPKKRWRYCYAANEDQAVALITSQNPLIHIYRDTLQECDFMKEWEDDIKELVAEVTTAIEKNEDPKFAPKWSILKEHLIDLFHGKCGYCEAHFTHTGFGDVEHYRPKGRVTEDQEHKGYYWLAYNPKNYLPSCQLCNQPAKKNHFPIAGIRARSQADSLDAEDPLLIDPYRDFYEEHLEFLPSTYSATPRTPLDLPGQVQGKTEKGRQSIAAMQIYREPIRQNRLREMTSARLALKNAYKALGETENWNEFARSIQIQLSEDRPFRTAIYYEFRDYLIRVKYWDEDSVTQAFAALGFNTG